MNKVKVSLKPIITNINLPTVIKTATLPGDSIEKVFVATQVGEIFYIGNGNIETFLDIRPQVLKLGSSSGGYDERGLLGLAFHPEFQYNGLFYIHYSVAGSQGPGALDSNFNPDPCDPNTLNLQWTNRETKYNHIDTVEEWIIRADGPEKKRTMLSLRRPFLNHNGVNSLNFSPENGKLILTTGDGGSGHDPFNLSQNNMEIAGKVIEIDVAKNTFVDNPLVSSRFDELPTPVQETISVIAKGVRNIPGISFQSFYSRYIKYIGNVGQDLVESIFSFVYYNPVPVTQIIQDYLTHSEHVQNGFINFGWRSWEGVLPTTIFKSCSSKSSLNEKIITYYDEAIETSLWRINPLTCYFHEETRPDKIKATALTGVQVYMGSEIPELKESVVFTDLAQDEDFPSAARGVLAYTRIRADNKINDYNIIETDYNFGAKSAYYVSLGANLDQTKLYLGVYDSIRVTDFNQGTVYEILPYS